MQRTGLGFVLIGQTSVVLLEASTRSPRNAVLNASSKMQCAGFEFVLVYRRLRPLNLGGLDAVNWFECLCGISQLAKFVFRRPWRS